ncbi:MAG: hypothetical protein P1P90_00315 [Patescibacteria group bacterium]|nr:hypothetical protein [Patescibacteria group bacterium]
MIQVSEYLKMGYRGIVFLHKLDWVETADIKCIHTRQELVCFNRNGTPLRVTVHWRKNSRLNGKGLKQKIEMEEMITQADYETYLMQYGAEDDALFYQAVARKEHERREAERKILEMTPNCPICGNQMIFKYRSHEGVAYWICVVSSKGKCNGSCFIPDETSKKYRQLLEIANQI